MLYLDADLPPGVLLDQAGPRLAAAMAAVGGLWFQAEPEFVDTEHGAVTAWRPRQGRGVALPAQPNKGNARLGLDGLQLESGKNCGFVLEGAVQEAACLSFAVLFAAQSQDIRTILSVKLAAVKNYLFLYQQDSVLGLRDQGGGNAVVCDAVDGGWPKLVVGGVSDQRLYLRQGGAALHSAAVPDLEFAGAADVFIGCRSQREGLLKTFGTGAIAAVFFWPGLNILDPVCPAGAAQLRALEHYRLWET